MLPADEQYTHASQWISQNTTWYYTTILKDELGTILPSTAITTLTASWYDLQSPTFAPILDWDAKDVKNANGGTINTQGKFELRLPDTATIMLNSTLAYEWRRLLLTWVYASGTKTRRWEVDAIIKNLHRVP